MHQKRVNYSRRKPFVVAALLRAFQEKGIHTWKLEDISKLIEGKEVSKYSLKRCWKDLNLP